MAAHADHDLAEAAGLHAVEDAKHGEAYRHGSDSDDQKIQSVA